MNTIKKIIYLNVAELVFRQKPKFELCNTSGLCIFFKFVFKLTDDEVKDIMGNKYSNHHYAFGKSYRFATHKTGMSQNTIYRKKYSQFYYVRSDWCKKEIERLKKEL